MCENRQLNESELNATMPMQWTKEHDDLLVKEVLALDPYSSPKGSTERSNVWDSIAGHLNACSYVKFAVSGRSVKDRLQHVLIRNYKRKMSEEIRASGIEVDDLSDFETAMEEIAEKFDASEKDAANQSEDKKDKCEKEKKQAEEIRNKALERIGETKKRKLDEADESRDQNSLKSRRKQGNETIIYLKQKAEQDKGASRGTTAKEGCTSCTRKSPKGYDAAPHEATQSADVSL